MIDGGKLYDWLQALDIDLIKWDACGDGREIGREEWDRLFRQYVAELTGD